jgi:hypothetical protein
MEDKRQVIMMVFSATNGYLFPRQVVFVSTMHRCLHLQMKEKSNGLRWMHIKVVQFWSFFRLSEKSILFKCHKCIIKSSIWQKNLWLKIANLNKNIYWRVKFNKHTPII